MQLHAESLKHRFPGNAAAAASSATIDMSSITAAPSELTVLSGPSGSGKTTLVHMLSGLLKPQSGQVMWDQTDIATLGETARDKWRRTNAGLVFQDFLLIEGLSAHQNIVLPAYFSSFTQGTAGSRADELLDRFGIADRNRTVETYSRGEQQRIAIARALIFDPPVIFADEPTASLDVASAETVSNSLLGLVAAGKTVVVVTHDRELIDRADRLYRLEHGRLADAHTGDLVA